MLFFICAPILLTVLVAFGILVSPYWPLKKNINRKRFLIFLAATLVITGVVSGATYVMGTKSQMYSEVWHFKIISTKHEEQWTTEESYVVMVPSGTDSEGNVTYRTETRYRTDTHGPNWYATKEDGGSSHISEGEYNKWKRIWKNEKKTGVHRGSAAGFDKAISGDIFECAWPGSFETLYPWQEIHRYQNKVRNSKSVLKLKKPTEALKKQYPRPADNRNPSPVISYGVPVSGEDLLFLERVNASIGRKREMHMMFVLLQNAQREVVEDILSAWQGTNKNELVIFTGVDKEGNVLWCDVESWMDNTTFHGMIEDEMNNKKLDLKRAGQFIMDNSGKNWHRKEFKDFNYLGVSLPLYFYVADVVVILILCSISAVFINFNVVKRKRYRY